MLSDRQWLENRKKSGERGYTWSRAEETVRAIRALGGVADGTSSLDKLRHVITQIGNSLGYVRMVRNAGMRVIAKSLPCAEMFAPTCDFKKNETTASHQDAAMDRSIFSAAKTAECAPRMMKAAEVCDDVVQGVHSRFEAPADHLLILATFFGSAERRAAAEARGANLFHFLVPALSLSFLDALLLGREALEKRAASSAGSARSNALCFDDGFAVGIAFLLRIFGIETDFQALHWFEAKIAATDVSQGARVNTVVGAIGGGRSVGTVAGKRLEALEAELIVLDRTLEAASTLFGPPPSTKPLVAASGDSATETANEAEMPDTGPA